MVEGRLSDKLATRGLRLLAKTAPRDKRLP